MRAVVLMVCAVTLFGDCFASEASEANQQALQLVHDNQMMAGLELFRKATSLDPTHIEYANNAGAAALRLGLLAEARKHLKRAASIDPTSTLPQQNLADLELAESSNGLSQTPLAQYSSQRGPLDQLRPEDRFASKASNQPLPPPSKTRAPLLAEIAQVHRADGFRHSVRPLPRLSWRQLHEPRHALYRHGHRPFILVDTFAEDAAWRATIASSRAARSAAFGAHGAAAVDPAGPTASVRALPVWDSPALHVAPNGSVSRWDPREPGGGGGVAVPEALLSGHVTSQALGGYGVAGGLATRSTWTLRALVERFGGRRADAYPHNMEESNVRPVITTLREGLKELLEVGGARARSPVRPESGYVQWNMAPRDWAAVVRSLPGPLPAQFRDDEAWLQACMDDEGPKSEWVAAGPPPDLSWDFHLNTHWRMMLIGSWGGGMFGHWDVLATSSWQFHVAGAKRWHICPPSQRRSIGDAGEFDAFSPDYAALPGTRRLACFLDVVLPGEFLYYPRNYWHQTENLVTPTISLTSTIADARNHRGVANELQRECLGLGRVMRPSAGLCAALTSCFAWWEAALEGAAAGRNATDLGREALPVEVAIDGKQPMQRVPVAPRQSALDAGAALRGSGRAPVRPGDDFEAAWMADSLGGANWHVCPRQRAAAAKHVW